MNPVQPVSPKMAGTEEPKPLCVALFEGDSPEDGKLVCYSTSQALVADVAAGMSLRLEWQKGWGK